MTDSQTYVALHRVDERMESMLDRLAAKPSRAELADAALKAATELGIMIKKEVDVRDDRISQFRDILHQTTEGWLNEKTDRLTDALTARLYFAAYEQAHGNTAKSLDEFLANIRSMLRDFDDFDEKRKDLNALQEMLKFALALHTLLIGEAYGHLSHWKHKELL